MPLKPGQPYRASGQSSARGRGTASRTNFAPGVRRLPHAPQKRLPLEGGGATGGGATGHGATGGGATGRGATGRGATGDGATGRGAAGGGATGGGA